MHPARLTLFCVYWHCSIVGSASWSLWHLLRVGHMCRRAQSSQTLLHQICSKCELIPEIFFVENISSM